MPVKKAEVTAEGNFSQPSSKHHSFTEVFLVSLIINLIRGERGDFEITSRLKGENAVSCQNGHCIPETIEFDFRVILLRRINYL